MIVIIRVCVKIFLMVVSNEARQIKKIIQSGSFQKSVFVPEIREGVF